MQLRQPSQYWCGGNEAHALTGALRKADQAKELLVWSARTSRSVPFTHSGRVRDCVTGGAWGTCITTGRDMRGTVRCQSWRGLALLKTLAVCGEGWCCRHRQCWNDRNEDSGCLCATICCRRITYEGRVHKIMGKHTRNIHPPPNPPHGTPPPHKCNMLPPAHTHTRTPPPPHTHTREEWYTVRLLRFQNMTQGLWMKQLSLQPPSFHHHFLRTVCLNQILACRFYPWSRNHSKTSDHEIKTLKKT